MACAGCSKRRRQARTGRGVQRSRGAVRQSSANLQNSGGNQLQSNDFVRLVYIGPDQEINSVTVGLSYGYKTYGDRMMVHKDDITAHPDWWVENVIEIIEEATEEETREEVDTEEG